MPSILLVDPDPESRSAFSDFLGQAGFDVRTAKDGRAGLMSARLTSPDFVVLDVQPSQAGGIEFLSDVRARPEWAALPVIVLTDSDGPHLDRVRQLGVKCILLKSRDELPRLLACIESMQKTPGGTCVGDCCSRPRVPAAKPQGTAT